MQTASSQSNEMAASNKRNAISLENKIKILKEVDKKILKKSEIARVFKIPKSTLFGIIKNRDSILKNEELGIKSSRNRSRDGKFQKLEEGLYEWLKIMRSKNVPIDGNLLKSKALSFAQKMDIDETVFKASDGWLQKFKVRHGLSFRKLCGESGAVNKETVDKWKEEKLKNIIEKHDPEDIFNADETGLFFMMKPDRSFVFKNEAASGGKEAKQRLTVLLCSNMSGTEKLPLLAIGKSKKPRCFKGIKTLPVMYKNNSKSWMTSIIFEEWLRCLDKKMTSKRRKIVLVIDNCTAHPEIKGLKSVTVEYFPPNVTPILQPLDQGVIMSFKRNYRKFLLQKIISALDEDEDFKVDILTALYLSKAAWDSVTEKTIRNCFRKAGFKKKSETESTAEIIDQVIENENFNEEEEMLQEISTKMKLYENLNFDEYAAIDNDLECVENLSENELLVSRYCAQEESASSSDEEEEIEEPKLPSIKNVSSAIETLKCFFEREENAELYLSSLTEMQNYVFKKSHLQKKQTNITDFFFRK